VPNLKKLLQELQKTTADYDYAVFHQANLLMNETLRKMMKLEKEKVPYSIQKYGNTSSASIPLTIVSELREKINSGKVNLLVSGFGVGLSWGSIAMEIENVVCPEVLDF
jgi:3-oxoacyl-[acyl-carrier-protein] synthase-3